MPHQEGIQTLKTEVPVRKLSEIIPQIKTESKEGAYEFECAYCRQPMMLHKPQCGTCGTSNDYYEPFLA